jgi:hypothetical protein
VHRVKREKLIWIKILQLFVRPVKTELLRQNRQLSA